MLLTLPRFSCRYDYLRCPVVRGLPVLSGLALATSLQPPIPSGGGSVTPGSHVCLQCERRNINRLVIGCPSRVPLSPRLTLMRLALFRKPWAFGGGVSTPLVVTHAYIFFSGRSRMSRDTPSAPTGMLPYHSVPGTESLVSAAVLMPVHHPRDVARLVSCYALFK